MSFSQNLYHEILTVLANTRPLDSDDVLASLSMNVSMVDCWEDNARNTSHVIVRSGDTGQFAEVVSYHLYVKEWSDTTVKEVFPLAYREVDLPVFGGREHKNCVVDVSSPQLRVLLDSMVEFSEMVIGTDYPCIGLSDFYNPYDKNSDRNTSSLEVPEGVEMVTVPTEETSYSSPASPPEMFYRTGLGTEQGSRMYVGDEYGLVFHALDTDEYVALQCCRCYQDETCDNAIYLSDSGHYRAVDSNLWSLDVVSTEREYRYVRA